MRKQWWPSERNEGGEREETELRSVVLSCQVLSSAVKSGQEQVKGNM